jgi:hypothetical protein
MALAAYLRRASSIQPARLHDRRVRRAAEMQGVAPPRAAIDPRMLLCRSVTRFARDTEFHCLRVGGLRQDRLRSERRIELGPAVGRVTRNADRIPGAGFETPADPADASPPRDVESIAAQRPARSREAD